MIDNHSKMRKRIGPKAINWIYSDLMAIGNDEKCYKLTDSQIAALLAVTSEQMTWSTRWYNYDDFELVSQYVTDISCRLMSPVDCMPITIPYRLLPECIGVYRDGDCVVIDICEGKCAMPIVVNFYDGCGCGPSISGCGCGSLVNGNEVNSGGSALGGTDGYIDYGNIATLLDMCANFTIVISHFEQALDKIQTGSFIGEQFALWLPAWRELFETVRTSITDIEGELYDAGFIELAKLAALKVFNDPLGDITRQQLRDFAWKLPFVYGGAPMQAGFVLASELVNLTSFNYALRDVAGSGQANSACADLMGSIGRTPYIPDFSGSAVNVDFGSFWLTRSFDISWSVSSAESPVVALDMSGQYPGLVGYYINVEGGLTSGNGTIQIASSANSVFVNGVGQIIDWNSTLDVPFFRGGARISQWENDTLYDGVPDASIDLAQIATGTYTFAFGHSNTQFPELTATAWLVIDSAVQPFPGASG